MKNPSGWLQVKTDKISKDEFAGEVDRLSVEREPETMKLIFNKQR
jgi:hypothetical protein